MKRTLFIVALTIFTVTLQAAKVYKPWDNGKLKVSDNHRYLIHENGTPFFWMGNTSWLLPERLNRDEVEFFLTREREEGYNVEQIQVLNAIPTYNIYGQQANDESFDFTKFTKPGTYGYCHMHPHVSMWLETSHHSIHNFISDADAGCSREEYAVFRVL